MNVIIYFLIFCMGITFGSFFTLAVYRIPLRQDITHERSYCPNCGHKLSFWDMIPVLSYIFLGGKCRYCKKKIRIRYLILEILSGISFVLFAMSLNLDFFRLEINELVYLAVGLLYIAGLFILAGIDKEKFEIRNEVLLYTILVTVIYIIYLYIVEKTNIYRYVIYLFFVAVFIWLNNIYFSKNAMNNYTLQCLSLILTMLSFTYEACTILTIACSIIAIEFTLIINKIKNRTAKCIKNDVKKKCNLPIAYYLCVSNIIFLIITNFMVFSK